MESWGNILEPKDEQDNDDGSEGQDSEKSDLCCERLWNAEMTQLKGTDDKIPYCDRNIKSET